jgi:hypothetical protein
MNIRERKKENTSHVTHSSSAMSTQHKKNLHAQNPQKPAFLVKEGRLKKLPHPRRGINPKTLLLFSFQKIILFSCQ